jgi:hypothetical protein
VFSRVVAEVTEGYGTVSEASRAADDARGVGATTARRNDDHPRGAG